MFSSKNYPSSSDKQIACTLISTVIINLCFVSSIHSFADENRQDDGHLKNFTLTLSLTRRAIFILFHFWKVYTPIFLFFFNEMESLPALRKQIHLKKFVSCFLRHRLCPYTMAYNSVHGLNWLGTLGDLPAFANRVLILKVCAISLSHPDL